MMMECPRCGFSQPKDQFCAQCGLDVEHYRAKPKPLWIRLIQNPNFHLGLIAVLIAVLVGYILHSRQQFMGHDTSSMDANRPLTSRDAAVPQASTPKPAPQAQPAPRPAPPPTSALALKSMVTAKKLVKLQEPKAAAKIPDVKRMQLSFWEVPRNLLVSLIDPAERLSESNEGRVYLVADAQKAMDTLQKGSRRLALDRNARLGSGSRILVETPPNGSEAFQFGLLIQVTGVKTQPQIGKTAVLKLDSSLVMAPPETTAEASSNVPTMRPLVQSNISGTASLTPGKVLLIVLEPNTRNPSSQDLAKVGQGPWSIFSSQAFRAGMTDWVMVLRLD